MSAELVNTEETTKTENAIDFKGEWKTASLKAKAKVGFQLCGYWFGVLYIEPETGGEYEIPSFWDKKGISLNPAFNLIERRRGAEVWAG